VTESEGSLINTLAHIEDISRELAVASSATSEILIKIDNIIDPERISNIIENTETITSGIAEVDFQQVNLFLQLLNETTQRTTLMISRLDAVVHRSSPDIAAIIEELRETIENLNEFSRIITDDPSILIRSRRTN
jgi:hypothetical protein